MPHTSRMAALLADPLEVHVGGCSEHVIGQTQLAGDGIGVLDGVVGVGQRRRHVDVQLTQGDAANEGAGLGADDDVVAHVLSQPQTPHAVNHKLRILDLFCGVGGAAMGYRLAFPDAEIVGVDIVRQPQYPFTFEARDALGLSVDEVRSFDFVHASPPCKAHTVARHVSAARNPPLFAVHPDLIPATRELLTAAGVPWVIENVPGAPLIAPFVLCGSSFGLRVRRHRLFEASFPVSPPACDHKAQGQPVGVYGNGGAWTRTAPGGGGVKVAGKDAADALGIGWTVHQPSLSQAIPPAYTRYIGECFATLERAA